MTSNNAYLNSLKNIKPAHLAAAFEAAGITKQQESDILASAWTAQREDTRKEAKASELPFLTEDDLSAGIWLEFFDLTGKLSDAFKDSVGIVEQPRVMLVVDGKIKTLNPDDKVVLFRSPPQPVEG